VNCSISPFGRVSMAYLVSLGAWRAASFCERLWEEGLLEYDRTKDLDWKSQVMDGVMTKAPLGGKRPKGEVSLPTAKRRI